MVAITLAERYSSFLDKNIGIDGHAEIIGIGDKSFTLKLKGQHWKGRLGCWLKEHISLLFKRKNKSHTDAAMQQFEADILSGVMTDESRTIIARKLKKLKVAGVPLRVKHLRELNQHIAKTANPRSPALVTQEIDNVATLVGKNGTRLKAKDGDVVTVTIARLSPGTADYEKALHEISGEPENFYKHHLKNKIDHSDDQPVDFALSPQKNKELHEIWARAVSEGVEKVDLEGVHGSQLQRISNRVIERLSVEIQGSRKLQPEEIQGVVAKEAKSFYKDASQLMKQQYDIKTNDTLKDDDIRNMQTDVLRKMEETAISTRGNILYGRNAAEAFERAVIQYCHENPLQFTFPEDYWSIPTNLDN